MEEVAYQLAYHMAERGHEITVFTTSENLPAFVEKKALSILYHYQYSPLFFGNVF